MERNDWNWWWKGWEVVLLLLIHTSLYSLIEIIRLATLCTTQEAAIKRKDVRDPTTLLNSIIIFTLCCELCVECPVPSFKFEFQFLECLSIFILHANAFRHISRFYGAPLISRTHWKASTLSHLLSGQRGLSMNFIHTCTCMKCQMGYYKIQFLKNLTFQNIHR